MIKLWNGRLLYQISRSWNGGRTGGKDGYNLNQSRYENYTYVQNNQDFKNFISEYNEIFKKTVDILEKDVIYFFKESKYPRFKFSANCKNLKTIKIENATKIITPNIISVSSFNRHGKNSFIVECTLTNNSYLCNHHYGAQIHKEFSKPSIEDSFVYLLQEKFLIQGNNYTVYHDIEAFNIQNSDNPEEFINNVLNNLNKCISEESLEKYVSKDSTELNAEIYDSINNMLQSKDSTTVELGIKMLNNFNIEKSTLKIGMLIRSNIERIIKNKAYSSTGFKNVIKQLNLDTNSIRFGDNLTYLNKLYVSSEKDKDEIRDLTVKEMLNQINSFYLSQIRKVSSMGLNIKLDIF